MRKPSATTAPVVTARDVLEHARTLDDERADVVYCTVHSPLGPLLAAATKVGLVTLAYEDAGLKNILDRISTLISGTIARGTTRLDEVRLQLDEYFAGKRTEFEIPIDWTLVKGYAREVLKATAEIPYGQVMSYREVAKTTGRDKAVRAAGNALGSNPIPVIVPCHRVLRSDGSLGGYTGGLEKKKLLLELEGYL